MSSMLNLLFKIECFCLILLAYSVVIYTAAEAIATTAQKQLSPREIILYRQIEQKRLRERERQREIQTQLQEQRERARQRQQEWRQRQSEMRQRQLRRLYKSRTFFIILSVGNESST